MYADFSRTAAAALILSSLTAYASGPTACASAPLAVVPPPITTVGSVTTHSGQRLQFRADIGLLRVKGGGVPYGKSVYSVPDEESTPNTATMSYYAYSATGVSDETARPIIFIWDGGPGTATMPMLLNSFGPVVLNVDRRPLQKVAASMRPNPDTLLDVADLVFVDAPGTGFGQLEGCDAARDFYGIDVDAAVFQRFIQQYLHAVHRERSPMILMGESYGTTRAVVVAKRFQDAGDPVSGIVLISPLLAFDAWSDGAKANVGTENAFYLTLPTYAATAWAHGKVAHIGDLTSWLHEVERFSLEAYAPALLQGANLPPEQRQAIAARLASYTGIPARTWIDENLRIEASHFRNLLEADEGRIVGREDTRSDGPMPKVHGTAVEDDPTPTAERALRQDAITAYVRGTLGWGQRTFTPYIDGPDTRWNMHHLTDPGAWPDTYANVAPDLAGAMAENPGLRTLVFAGYFDLASPYFGTPYLISQLPFEDVRSRIHYKVYDAPHSVYEVDGARRDMHDRIATLIRH